MAVSQGLVLSFLLERGGSVRNSELLGFFRDFISSSEPTERSRNRDLFKNFVNNVAVVQQVDDVKYVVVKKKYRELVKGGGHLDRSESFSSSLGASPTPPSDLHTKPAVDAFNNNNNLSFFSKSPHSCTKPHSPGSSDGDAGLISSGSNPRSSLDDSLTAAVLSVSNNSRVGKKGAVFAVVAIKSPPQANARCEKVKPIHKTPGEDPPAQIQVPSSGLVKRSLVPVNSWGYPGDGHLYRSLRSKRRQSVVPSSPATKRGTEPGLDTKDLVPQEPREHEWLVKAATGRWGQVCGLLLQDVRLVEKRSFTSGFTVLHWAAKKGNSKMVRQIFDLSRQGGVEVEVNAKSHDGYTPLHIAAIHSHEAVLNLLVHHYGAKCNIRDNSGKKPYHYLPKDASREVRETLGDPQVPPVAAERSEGEQRCSDVPKGFNTFSKLFQPNVGHGQKKKPRHRPSFHFISDDQDENRRDFSTFNRKLLH